MRKISQYIDNKEKENEKKIMDFFVKKELEIKNTTKINKFFDVYENKNKFRTEILKSFLNTVEPGEDSYSYISSRFFDVLYKLSLMENELLESFKEIYYKGMKNEKELSDGLKKGNI